MSLRDPRAQALLGFIRERGDEVGTRERFYLLGDDPEIFRLSELLEHDGADPLAGPEFYLALRDLYVEWLDTMTPGERRDLFEYNVRRGTGNTNYMLEDDPVFEPYHPPLVRRP